jgi:hypothetical protein
MSSGKWKAAKIDVWLDRRAWWTQAVKIGVVAALFILIIGGGCAWWVVNGVPASSVHCRNAYAAARTATDTARVDAIPVESPWRSRRVSCGVLRVNDSLRHVRAESPER